MKIDPLRHRGYSPHKEFDRSEIFCNDSRASSDLYDQNEPNIDPQHRAHLALWRAVILQALNDAVRPKAIGGSKGHVIERSQAMSAAQHWLLRDEVDFPHVCHLAEVDPDVIRERAVTVLSVEQP